MMHISLFKKASHCSTSAKGAGVYHRGFTNLMHWFVTEFALDNRDRNLLLTSLSFDLTQKNLYASLVTGGILCIPEKNYFEPHTLLSHISREGITWINCTPGMFYKLVEYEAHSETKQLTTLRYVFLGGEPIAVTLLLPWLESDACRAQIVNTYGPTECTDICASYRVRQPRRFLQETIPVGLPVYNVQLYIVDKYLQVVPAGVTGELLIRGAGVGIGYLNDKNLTSGKFIRHTFEPNQPEQLLYRTGDLVKRGPDGNIEFVGRMDHQVKVRGFRVEIGEIENQLLSNQQVKEAVVLALEGQDGDRCLCAYIVPHKIDCFRENEIKNYLAKKLPDYMVPSYFMLLEKMPLNPHGKVDRKALPEPAKKVGKDYVPPGNKSETILARLWSEVLNLDRSTIGVHDNFFHLGGHSLKAVGLLNRIHKEFSVQVPLGELFKNPYIRDIAGYIQRSRSTLHTDIEPVEKKEYYPLSSAQKRLYILQQMELESTAYNMPRVLPLSESADIKRLTAAFRELIRRHESLRTSFHIFHDKPFQQIHDHVEFKIEYYLATEDTENTEEKNYKLQNTNYKQIPNYKPQITNKKETKSHHSSFIIHHSFVRPFDLSRARLLRVGLIEANKGKHLLLVDTHHIIMDGTSTDIFKREFITLYQEEKLAPLRLQYKDFAQWQTNEKQRESIKQQEVYWLERFPPTGEVPVLNLPIDYPRPIMQSFAGSSVDFVLSQKETRALKHMAQEMGGTLYMVILAVYTVLLSKLSGQEDIIIGTPIAARRHVDLEHIIGMFANSIAVRNYPSAEKSFKEFLGEVKECTLAAFENQEYQFEDLVEKVVLQRDTSRNPLFDVMFNLLDPADYTDKLNRILEPNADENEYAYEQVTAKFDLNLTAVEPGGKLHFNLEYCTRLFKPGTIHRLTGYFRNLAALLSENEDNRMKLADLDILTGKEKREILEISTGIEEIYDRYTGQTIHRWFEEQVEKKPDGIAVIGHSAGLRAQGVNERSALCSMRHALTYRELNRRANQLAGALRKKGVKPDTVVVIMMGRSIEMIAAILSILKAGGAYLPIDAQYPDVRKQYMLEDSGAKLLLINYNIQHEQVSAFIPNEIPIIDTRDEKIYHGDERNPEHINAKRGSDLLYVIYTSGSTGKPKGVMLEHINLVNLIRYQSKYTNIDCSRVLQFTTISFDVSFQEIFSTLLAGGQLCLVDEETRRDIPALFRLIEKNQVRTLFLPASFLKFVLNEEEYSGLIPGCIDHIASAGEQLVVGDSLRKYLNQHQVFLHNHYGPAEAHVVTTLTLNPNAEIPVHPSIGRPISNCRICILDNRDHLQTIGVSGQLVISGIPVGRGYLNRPELTAEKFCLRRARCFTGVFSRKPPREASGPREISAKSFLLKRTGKRIYSHMSYIYKTGDLARWLSDGNIEFLGRIDTQVKIRGFRIELGEIENHLANHADIKDAVVVAKEAANQTGERYLCAYVVAGKEFQVAELREYLSRNLPDYMIPSYFVPLEQIPLNPNRKVDKKALPEPDLISVNTNGTYAEPRDRVQKKLVNLWAEVLGIETGVIGIDDNFFRLGGHSLKAAVLTSKLHKEFQVKVPLAEVFQNPTIRGLSQRIKGMKTGGYTSIRPGEEKEFYPASFNQKRLWLLNQNSARASTFNMAGIITLDHNVDIHLVKKVLNRIIRQHDSFRTGFKVISDQLVQVIKKEIEIPFKMNDVSSITAPGKEKKKQEIYSRELETPFDLQQMPLFRAALLKLAEGKYELLFNMHHIISDGWSIEILKQEFNTLYDAYKKGIPCDIDMQPLEIQYKDYAGWQNQLLADEGKMAEAKEFWKGYLGGTLSVLNLPYDFTHYSDSTASSAYRCVVPESLTNQLRNMAADSHASLFMILLAGINILLSQAAGQEDIILAIPAAARQHESLNNIVGLFVNTLILRSKINSEESFMDFFKHFQDNTFKILDYQDIPLELIFSQLKIKYPIISVFFNMINIGSTHQQTLAHLESCHMEKVQDAKFDIVCYVSEYKNGIELNCHYLRNRFKPHSIEKLMDFYKKTLEKICGEPGKKLKEYRFTRKKKTLKRHN